MTGEAKVAFIRDRAACGDANAVLWSIHAVQRLVAHGLSRRLVEAALRDCELVEDYQEGQRALPDCLVLGTMGDVAHPLHAVVAIDVVARRILVVTVYSPRSERWNHDWKTRR